MKPKFFSLGRQMTAVAITMAVVTLSSAVPVSASTGNGHVFKVNGVNKAVSSVSYSGARMYSLTDLAKTLGLSAKRNNETRQITINGNGLNMVFTSNSKIVKVNGKNITIGYPVKQYYGKTYAYVDALLDDMGYCYNETANTLQLNKYVTLVKDFDANGTTSSVKSIVVEKAQLTSLNDVVNSLKLKLQFDTKTKKYIVTGSNLKIIVNINSKSIIINGVHKTLAHKVEMVNGNIYLNIESLLNDMGYYYTSTNNKLSAVKLLSGDFVIKGWVDNNQLLIVSETVSGSDYYLINIHNRKSEKILGSQLNITDATPSPDGTRIAYTNDNGDVYIYNISTKVSDMVSTDNIVKYEIKWSIDGDSIFFIQGDKMNELAKITLSSKITTKILSDGVNYKSDLKVSANGKVFLYTVTKAGVISGTDETDLIVDTTGTEPQLFTLDTSNVDAVPQQLTTTSDNKLFGDFIGTTGYMYVSYNTNNSNVGPVITILNLDNSKTFVVASHLNIHQALVVDGKVMILATDAKNVKGIYTLESKSFEISKICTVSDKVEKIFITADGKSIAAEVNGQIGTIVSILKVNSIYNITK